MHAYISFTQNYSILIYEKRFFVNFNSKIKTPSQTEFNKISNLKLRNIYAHTKVQFNILHFKSNQTEWETLYIN
jgi:hypothetical protein